MPTHIVRAESFESRGTRAAEITDKAASKIEEARGHFKNGAPESDQTLGLRPPGLGKKESEWQPKPDTARARYRTKVR